MRPELQNRFRFDFRFGFGMVTADDGMAEISVWERKMGNVDRRTGGGNLFIDNWVRAS